jgi:hypothetical protein
MSRNPLHSSLRVILSVLLLLAPVLTHKDATGQIRISEKTPSRQLGYGL